MGKASKCLLKGKHARVDQAHAPLACMKTCLQHACPAREAALHASYAGIPDRSLEIGLWACKCQLNSCAATAELAQILGCLLNHGNRERINKRIEMVREQAMSSVLAPLLPARLLVTATPLGHPSSVPCC